MLELEELRLRLLGMKPQIDDLADALGLEQCRAEVRRLEAQQARGLDGDASLADPLVPDALGGHRLAEGDA